MSCLREQIYQALPAYSCSGAGEPGNEASPNVGYLLGVLYMNNMMPTKVDVSHV